MKAIDNTTKIPEILSNNKLHSIEGMRAISIIYVLAAHFSLRMNNKYLTYIFEGGRLGVYVFFVISGFLITTLLLKEKVKHNNISLRQFYARRLIRILPVAYLYLLLLFVTTMFLHIKLSVKDFVGSAFFLMNYSFFHNSNWLTGHYLSLSIEEQFYFLFPFLLKKSFKLYFWFLIIFLFIIIFIKCFGNSLVHSGATFFYKNPEAINYFDGIIIGSLTSILLFKNKINLKLVQRYKTLIHLIFIPLLVLIFNDHLPILYIHYFGRFNSVLCSLMIAILLISNLYGNKDFFFKLLNAKPLRIIGILSYSLYIYNMAFTAQENFPTANLPILINILLLFACAFISYTYFEKPILVLRNRFRKNKLSSTEIN